MHALSITNLIKTYSNGVHALEGISLNVKKGEIYGLLGPNGAGKSTTIGIVTGLVVKDSGSVKIFDTDIDKDFSKAKMHIGIVPQEFNFSIFERVIDVLTTQAGYYGVPLKTALPRAERYLKKLGLWEKKDHITRSLSGGLKRRLMIARSLMHEPKLLILDEPTAGVDVELRRSMWEFITELNSKGVTIILTTHYLEEAEHLCNHIAIINKGKIIKNATKKDLLSELDRETFIFDLKTPLTKKLDAFKSKQIDENTIEIELTKKQTLNDVFSAFDKEGIAISSMRNKSNRLEELFMELTK